MAIHFGTGRSWGGISQHEYRRMAQDSRHQLAYRVHFAALGWADCQGHASFGPGFLSAAIISKLCSSHFLSSRSAGFSPDAAEGFYRLVDAV
ncbi:hypothetical protein [Streptomyces sp. NPDC048551]|uniref:hypothetical protein n=1 Tax=Streptomyces sp. NPDC048551 TaxID=3155758 RepID=UPI00341DD438